MEQRDTWKLIIVFYGNLGHFRLENGASCQRLYDCNFLVNAKICISMFLILFQNFVYFYYIST